MLCVKVVQAWADRIDKKEGDRALFTQELSQRAKIAYEWHVAALRNDDAKLSAIKLRVRSDYKEFQGITVHSDHPGSQNAENSSHMPTSERSV